MSVRMLPVVKIKIQGAWKTAISGALIFINENQLSSLPGEGGGGGGGIMPHDFL